MLGIWMRLGNFETDLKRDLLNMLLKLPLVVMASAMVMVCHGATPLENNFMDCPGNDDNWGILRTCCNSDQLPKDCECFDISDMTDFTNSAYHKPECPDVLDIKFTLFTRQNQNAGAAIRSGQANILGTPYQGSRKTMIVTHGFTDNGFAPWLLQMKDELLLQGDMNVILLDWQKGAVAPNYYQAVANTRAVGAMVGRLIQDLNAFTGASFDSFHLAGHSLGAQIMGYAGKEIYRLTGDLVGRISGLDPAGPAFESYSAYVRIDLSDAKFVDIWHTDAEELLSSGYGTRYSIGHVDFYPNGGQHQPGCPPETLGILSMVSFEDEKEGGACSHGRAVDYFSNSINKCRYDPPTGGAQCTMGYHVQTTCRGDYYPTTTGTEPFC